MPQRVFWLPNPSNPHVSVLPAKVEINYPTTTSATSTVAIRANLLISSQGYTMDNGELAFHLENLNAGGGQWSGEAVIIDPNVVFIATALSESPVIITWSKEYKKISSDSYSGYYDLLSGTRLNRKTRYDITIKVRSWTLDSEPAPYVTFGWLCIAEGAGWEPPA